MQETGPFPPQLSPRGADPRSLAALAALSSSVPPCLRGFLAPHGRCGTKAAGQRQRDKAILAPQAQGWPSTAGTRLSPSQPCCEGVPRGGLPALQGGFGARRIKMQLGAAPTSWGKVTPWHGGSQGLHRSLVAQEGSASRSRSSVAKGLSPRVLPRS